MPPTLPQSRRESGAIINDQERLLTSQEKTAASIPRGWGYRLQGGSQEEREKKGGGGGENAEWDHQEFGKNEAHPPGR